MRILIVLAALLISILLPAQQKAAKGQAPQQKPRVLISTDIGGTDPDDNQSVAHLLMFSDCFELEGLVSSPSFGDGSAKEIMRMIDVYEQDYPTLRRHARNLMKPKVLRPLVKQGRTSEMPACGYGEPTEGSQWIVRQARKQDPRPLYVLVWGCLEDVAQALHDAPDIAPKLRVHWIGGPNKKWGVNAYCYIVENFPNLWMIENNTTYRGFIYDSKDRGQWDMGFFDAFIKESGHLGLDFAAYYKGNPKLGDTPSLLYMMSGDPANPEGTSWAGSFVRCSRTPRTVLKRRLMDGEWYQSTVAIRDTAQICGIIEWQLQGPVRNDVAIDSACITIDIRRQQWKGYYKGNGLYVLRHSTYYTGTLPYIITSTLQDFPPLRGEVTIDNTWDVPAKPTDYVVGSQWWTDSYAPSHYWKNRAGAALQRAVRQESMQAWAERWQWLRK